MSLELRQERQSNIELLRCFAMFCIIVYHIFIFALQPIHHDTKLYQALQIPFHIGVPLFVIISGYFGIKFSLRGLMRLCCKGYGYVVPLTLIPAIFAAEGTKELLKHVFILGFDALWYLNTYLYLFLFSPVINRYLSGITLIQRYYLLSILAFMSIYIGNVTEGDPYLVEGKNLTNFMLLYVIGNTIRFYQEKINSLSQTKLVVSYLLFNIGLVLGFMYVPLIAGKIWKYSFAYHSPIIILNCIWIFMIFSKLSFNSKFVNWAGCSIFACYLIQCPYIVWKNCFEAPARAIDGLMTASYLTIPAIAVWSILAMFVIICVDKFFNPIWEKFISYAAYYDNKWNTKQLR